MISISFASADDLAYIDERFPYNQLYGSERIHKAAQCTKEGDGRCYLQVVAEVLRNFRHSDEPNQILRQYNLSYFVNAINQWEYNIKRKRDNYVYLSQAIYYGHKNLLNGDCNLDGSLGFSGPLDDLDSVNLSLCETSQCQNDVKHYVRGFQNFYRKYCSR